MSLWRKFTALFHREKLDAEMAEEMRHHLEELTARNVQAGMSAEEARQAARRAFGGVEQVKERAREQRGFVWLEHAAQDVRYAGRSLRRQPAFAATVILTLALGIGANTAIFSVVHAVLLRSLPYREPAELVRVFATTSTNRTPATAPDFADWREGARSFAAMAAATGRSYNLTGQGKPERVAGTRVSANYFDVLGVTPALGRTFAVDEEKFGAGGVVLLSHGFWQRQFAGDPAAIGRAIVLDGEPHTVIGVLPEALESLSGSTPVWTPLALTEREARSNGNRRFTVTARLRPGVTREQAQAEMVALATQIETKRPNSNKDWRAAVVPLAEAMAGSAQQPLFILLGAVGLVLLIACTNIAGLLLARGEARHREFAVRAALGAGRGRIVRQLLTESLLLALVGGGLGLWLATRGIDGLVWLLPASMPRLGDVKIDGVVLAFTAAVVVLTGVLCGLAPSLRAAKTDVNDALKQGGRAGSAQAGRARRGLVVTEIALALVLLIGAGLLVRSFWRLQTVATGVRAEPLLAMQVALPESRYPTPAQIAQFFDRVSERLREAPDVGALGLTSNVPFGGGGTGITVTLLDKAPGEPGRFGFGFYRGVSPGYFATIGVPLVAGRGLNERDRPGRARVAVVNQTMARTLWPNVNALGRQFLLDDREKTPIEVVGIVADVKHFGPAAEPRPEIFVPYMQASESFWQFRARSLDLVIQPRGEPAAAVAAAQRAIAAVDADLPLFRVTTVEQLRRDTVAMPRVYSALLGGFALLALLLAAIGIYGVISYTVAQREREIGVRMALGASQGDVLWLVVGEGARLALLGAGLGVLGALGLTRFIASQLYDVSATDPALFAGVAGLLVVIALVACWLPARRAAKVDPMVALRSE